MLIDGQAVKSCTILAVQADGASVTTIEGLAPVGTLHPVQQAFWNEHGLQCGFCTPGMVLSTVALLADDPDPERGIDPARAGREYLPLHWLPQHCALRADGRKITGRGSDSRAAAQSPIRRRGNEMNPSQFAYQRAGSVDEAIALLQEHGEGAKLIAGGHSLLPIMKLRLAEPETLVDIGRIPELRGVRPRQRRDRDRRSDYPSSDCHRRPDSVCYSAPRGHRGDRW